MPRRLDPRSVPYRGLQSAGQWAVGVFTLGIVIRGATDIDLPAAVIPAAAAAAGVAGLAWAVAYHRRFTYELTPESLDITSGVVSRRTRRIPLGRIQNVDIRQGLVPRLLDIAEVRFETAGGSGTEATLRFVALEVAQALQEHVDRHGETAVAPTEPESEGEAPLYAITSTELGWLSVTSIDWRAVGFVVLAVVGFGPGMVGSVDQVSPMAPLAAAAQPVVVTAAGIAGNAALMTARFYAFRLWRRRDTLRYERGLLRRFSGSIPLDRVHLLRLRDNPATRWLGFAALDIQTAGYGPEDAQGSAAAVPLADRDRVLELARSLEPFPALDLTRPPPRARLRYLVRYSLAIGVIVGGLYGVDLFWRAVPWTYGLVLLVMAPVAAHLTWRHRGFALGDRALVVQAGFWRRTTYVVPLYRVQTVGTTATVLQRRRALATVRIDTASGAPAAHDLDEADARQLREDVTAGLLADRPRRRTGPDLDTSRQPSSGDGDIAWVWPADRASESAEQEP